MNYPLSPHSEEEIIKKSRFIALVIPCSDEHTCLEQLNQLHSFHPNANHIAFAYRIMTGQGLAMRYHDDGEPSGTAGKPIYQHIEGKNLVNVLIVVIRYFGGIKLGAGGLTRAYGNSAKKAIEKTEFAPYIEFTTKRITLGYAELKNFEYQLSKLHGEIVAQNFTDQVELTVRIPVDKTVALNSLINT